MDVGPLVIANAQAAKLVQPRERALHDPAPPAQATPVRGAAHGQPGRDMAAPAARAESPPHRSRDPRVRSPDAAAAAPACLGVGESHRPEPALLASRSDWLPSTEPRAARRARRKSDDACSRAWLGPWDWARSGRLRTLRGRSSYRQQPATNQSARDARANRAARSASDPKCRPLANRATAASTSSRIRTRVPAAASARECHCDGRRQCRRDTLDQVRVAFRPLAVAVESAGTVRRDPIGSSAVAIPVHVTARTLRPLRSPCGRCCF